VRASRLLLITGSEYWRRMRRRGYVVASFLLPLLLGAGIVVAVHLGTRQRGATRPVGITDLAGLIVQMRQLPEDGAIRFVAVDGDGAARKAVLAGEVAAAFVISTDYRATRAVTSYSVGTLPREVRDAFERFVRWNLTQGLSPEAATRATDGISLVSRSLDGRRELSESTWPNAVIPFVGAILFFVTVISNAQSALQSIVDEKESRTVEILFTSVSPKELMAGKVLAIFLIGMTQLAVWMVALTVGLVVAKGQVPELRTFRLDWTFVLVVSAAFLPAYALITGLLAGIGALSSETREGQQLTVLVTLPTFAPTWFTALLMSSPNGPGSVALTMFPLTAPLTISIRWAFATIPTWQLVLSISLLVLSAAGAIYFASRMFETGMLRYGRRLSWAEVRSALGARRQR
jgi:ABC-2 type transport system permease protein